MRNILFLFTLLVATHSDLTANNKDRVLRDLDIIKSTFETKYAPFEWKKAYSNWSLDDEIDRAKAQVNQTQSLTVHDYQKILHTFFISTCDYHVSNQYHSTEMALLPFTVKSAGGRYFISNLKTSYIEEMSRLGLYRGSQLPNVGDELLIFNGLPIDEAVAQLKREELGNPTSKTSQALAEDILTQRLRSLGHQVPQGTLELQFRTSKDEIVVAEMDWVYEPEMIANRPLNIMMMATVKTSKSSISAPLAVSLPDTTPERYQTLAINPIADALKVDHSKNYKRFFANAAKNAQIPNLSTLDEPTLDEPATGAQATRTLDRGTLNLGKKIWQEGVESPFKAYIYETPVTHKKIGYVRIGTYRPSGSTNAVTTLALQLANILRFFETKTDALVIDQVDNPGGYLLYAYAVLAMLTDKPLIGLQHQIAITQEDVAKALNDIEELTEELQMGGGICHYLGYPGTSEFLLAHIYYSEFIITEWESGRNLTLPVSSEGLGTIEPHPQAQYSKPIVMLVDSRDFSCADIVPAILQDNRRALIFGEQTAGAGGIVKQHSYPNIFGLANFSYTASIFERLNGDRLENLGVTPDVQYEVTPDDLTHGYQGYIRMVNETVEKAAK